MLHNMYIIHITRNLYYSQQLTHMKKTTFLLAITIFMFLATTMLIVLAFYVMPVSRINFILITLLSIMGYLGAACYYNLYLKKLKNKSF